MSDTTPIVPLMAPPNYSEVKASAPLMADVANTPTTIPSEPPPPYTPRAGNEVENTRPSYQTLAPAESGVVVTEVEMVELTHWGPQPCDTYCTYCCSYVTTVVAYTPGTLTCISAVICFLFCFVLAFLPFCISDLQDVQHFCPVCNSLLGTYRRL